MPTHAVTAFSTQSVREQALSFLESPSLTIAKRGVLGDRPCVKSGHGGVWDAGRVGQERYDCSRRATQRRVSSIFLNLKNLLILLRAKFSRSTRLRGSKRSTERIGTGPGQDLLIETHFPLFLRPPCRFTGPSTCSACPVLLMCPNSLLRDRYLYGKVR